MLRLANQQVSLDTMLLALVADRLSTLVWFKTKDGQKGKNRPAMISESLGSDQRKEKDVTVFESGEDFERTRLRLLGGGS